MRELFPRIFYLAWLRFDSLPLIVMRFMTIQNIGLTKRVSRAGHCSIS